MPKHIFEDTPIEDYNDVGLNQEEELSEKDAQ